MQTGPTRLALMTLGITRVARRPNGGKGEFRFRARKRLPSGVATWLTAAKAYRPNLDVFRLSELRDPIGEMLLLSPKAQFGPGGFATTRRGAQTHLWSASPLFAHSGRLELTRSGRL